VRCQKQGYYNPLLQHGEERAVKDAREAGANGFIVVDLPPEEAIKFRGICTSEGCVLAWAVAIFSISWLNLLGLKGCRIFH
jgi:tryptophan synthase alpha subunit